MDLPQVTEFFQWMTIIHIALLVLGSLMVMMLKGALGRWHSRLFGISEEQVAVAAYDYLGRYKTLALTFGIVPYVALLIMQ